MNDYSIPVAAPVDTDSAGKGGDKALQSVFRIISRELMATGTGFLHKSGNLITAEHVVRNTPSPIVVLADGRQFEATVLASDTDLDLAILAPKAALAMALSGNPLPISTSNNFSIGTQVSTWGFPGGYGGPLPMLSVGVLSAVTAEKKSAGLIKRWVVNAAFNSGNSGGPLLHIETGDVIGVVSSKLAPISQTSQSFLNALQGQGSGFMYTGTAPDGKSVTLSEGQIVAHILTELRQQVQLVIGMAVFLEDLRNFLRSAGIQP